MQEVFLFFAYFRRRARKLAAREVGLMNGVRTDLALEARELWQESAKNQTRIKGVIAREDTVRGFPVHRVEITTDEGARALGKPVGQYSTIELTGLSRRDERMFLRAIETLADELRPMLPQGKSGSVLVVGLGNHDITPDAVGSKSVQHVMVTRHLVEQMPELFGTLRRVAAIAPGVLGTTGIESREIIKCVARGIDPDCIIVVDALASRRLARLCRTIQITDTGIVPGSGVGNSRAAITAESMGAPVIAIGVPTVVDVTTIFADMAEAAKIPLPDAVLREFGERLMVTPKEIDVHIADVARIVGYAINTVLQQGVSVAEMDTFLS